jgi:hypothetical protein
MNYDQKKGQEWNLIFNHKYLESMDQMKSNWSVLYIIEKIFLRGIRYCPCIIKTDLIWKIYERPKFWNNKSSSLWILT